MRQKFSKLLGVGSLVGLLLFSIPWYWPENSIHPFILGLPIWAFVSLLFSFLFAIATAWAIHRFWKEEE